MKNTRQAATNLERITINFSGMSRHQGNSWCPILTGLRGRLAAQVYEETKAAMRRIPASFTRFSRRRHVVSAAIVRSIGALVAILPREPQIQNYTGILGLPEFLRLSHRSRIAATNTNV
jgi:hypothetical protein